VFPSCPWDRSRNFRVFASYGFRFNQGCHGISLKLLALLQSAPTV
jgi:hypothetical protein